MNRLMYWLFLKIGGHLDRLNWADANSNRNDWRSFPGAWDDYQPPFPNVYMTDWDHR